MKNNVKTKRLVGVAILLAITIGLQFISNYFPLFGQFSVTFALVPMIIGAILYGPLIGLLLGFMMGVIVLLAPSTASYFNVNPVMTIVICLVKGSMAGFVPGLFYRWLGKKHNNVAIIVSGLLAPIVNTSIFAVGSLLFFYNTLVEWAGGSNILYFLFIIMIGLNFVLEFSLNVVLAPTFVYLINVLTKKFDLGFQKLSNNKEKGEN